MKTKRLCSLLMLCGLLSTASAQNTDGTPNDSVQTIDIEIETIQPQPANQQAENTPILLIFANPHDHQHADCHRAFAHSMKPGFQQSQPPRFIVVGKQKRFLFGVGGFVETRAAYDMDGAVDNTDFITYDIPMIDSYNSRQALRMDASTSRLFFKVLGNTRSLGLVEGYIEGDFRGPDNTFDLREAYISMGGFTIGKAVTTFCDLTATPRTIDFQGPNGYTYGHNLQLRFHQNIGLCWSMAVAAEMPEVSATYGASAAPISQRVPDIPIYFQFSWGRFRSHLRASGIIRYMQYHNLVKGENQGKIGWGAQLSGNINAGEKFSFFMQGVYGEGISPYIRDIAGRGLDMVPNPTAEGELQPVRSLSLVGGVQFNASDRVFISAGYSQVRLYNDNGYFVPEMYRGGNYIVANTFWRLTENCQTGIEYLYGIRTNMNTDRNHANRLQAMVRYNF